jgi:Flp pilus assembly protein TadD
VTNRWFALALTCGVVFGGLAWNRVWWSKNDRRGSLLDQSRAAYKQQDWLTAKTKAVEQLKTDRTDPVALRLLRRTLYRLQCDQDAAAIFALLTPETIEAEDYLVRGQAAIRARDFELAVDNLRTALQLDPTHFESLVTLEQESELETDKSATR